MVINKVSFFALFIGLLSFLVSCGQQVSSPKAPTTLVETLVHPDGVPANGNNDQFVTVPMHLPDTNEVVEVKASVVDDLIVLGGDIILGQVDEGLTTQGTATPYSYRLWPANGDGTYKVPYIFDNALSSTRQGMINEAITHWENSTTIDFVQRTNEVDYVEFIGTSCGSFIGRIGGVQTIYAGCSAVGSIIHEIGHAVGLFHEHQHPDRDLYVDVYMENVLSGTEHNFDVYPNALKLGYYDYDSIMHYPASAFSNNGEKTIMPKDSSVPWWQLGQRDGLSPQDIQTINELYPPYIPSENEVPTVDAGSNQVIELPNTVNLSGTVSDDGLPTVSALQTTWSMVSGPGVVTFANPASPATTATFSAAGTYTLELLADDSEMSSSDTVTVTVNDPSPTPTVVTDTFSSSLNRKNPTRSFSINAAAGTAEAVLTFDGGKGKKSKNLTLKVYDSQGQLVKQVSGGSPVNLNAELASGNCVYEVSGDRVSFVLTVTYPAP